MANSYLPKEIALEMNHHPVASGTIPREGKRPQELCEKIYCIK